MGQYHAKILRWLGYDVTTCDPDPSKGADLTGVAVGMWRNAAAVAIAVPIQYAAEEAARWHSFNGRLLLEKPMARTVDEAECLADELVNVRVGVGYVERFNPVVRELRDYVEANGARRVDFARWNMRPSWDTQLDLRSHDVDLAHWLGVDDVAAYSVRARAPHCLRSISVTNDEGSGSVFDLTGHDAHPLCAEWHALLTDSPDVATMQDAAAVLAALGR